MKIIYNGENDTRNFKDVLGSFIAETLENDPNFVYLDADLMNCISTNGLLGKNDRAIDCGIAEANMIGIACGLSSAGLKPLCHSFGPFITRRCYDQIFLSGAYAKNSITLLGTDPGVCAAYNGGTHMPFEDMALMRAIPGAMVFDIADVPQIKSVLSQIYSMPGVKYLRVNRKGSVRIYEDDQKFELGRGITLCEGKDAAIIASGIMVAKALKAAQMLKAEGIEVTVVDMFTVKPIDTELVLKCAETCGTIVTAENHNKIGGLYSAVCETVAGKAPVRYVAVEDTFGEVGPMDYLEERFGLTAEHIYSEVKAALSEK